MEAGNYRIVDVPIPGDINLPQEKDIAQPAQGSYSLAVNVEINPCPWIHYLVMAEQP